MRLLKSKSRAIFQENCSTNWKRINYINQLIQQLLLMVKKTRKLSNRFWWSKARFHWKTSSSQSRSKGKITLEAQRSPFTSTTARSKSERNWQEYAKKRNCSPQVRLRASRQPWVMRCEHRYSRRYSSCSKLFYFCAAAPSCLWIGSHRHRGMLNWWWVSWSSFNRSLRISWTCVSWKMECSCSKTRYSTLIRPSRSS